MRESRFPAAEFLFTYGYCCLLVYLYVNYIFPRYEYIGLQLNERANIYLFLLVAFLSSLFVLLAPAKLEKPSDIFCYFSYFLIYIPAVNVSYFSLSTPGDSYFRLFFSFTLCISIILIGRNIHLKLPAIKELSERNFNFLILFLVIIFCIPVFYFYKINIGSLFSLQDISELYDIRSEYRSTNLNVPSIVQYVFAWLIKVIAPLVLILGLQRRNPLLVVGSVFLIISLFSVSGHKSTFSSFVLITGVWFALRSSRGVSLSRFAGIFFLVATLGLALSASGFGVITDVLIRRVMVTPGLLTGFYFEYYNPNNYTYLGHSIFSSIVDYGQSAPPPLIIGAHYFGRDTMSANVNYIASAYADFGIWGTLFFSLLGLAVFKVFDVVSNRKGVGIMVCVMVVMPTWSMVDSALLTTMLTHGLLPTLLLVLLLPSSYGDAGDHLY